MSVESGEEEMMSEGTTPERITQRDERHRPVEYIRADVAQTQIARAEDMATQAVQAAVTARAQLAERDAKIAELEAKQWDVIAQKFIDLDEHIMATAASVGCDSVASMAREIVKDRARIAELEAAQHEATSFFLTPHGEWLWGDKETPLVERIKAMAFEMDAKIDELEAAQVPRPVTEDMHTTPFHQCDWRGRVLAYDSIDKAWYEVVWEDEISEGRSRGLSHWMPLPPPPTTGT